MLKKIFKGSLIASICLIIACAVTIPFAVKATITKGIDLVTEYYREETVVNTLEVKQGQLVTISADDLNIKIMPSGGDNIWASCRLLGSEDASVKFALANDGTLQFIAKQKDARHVDERLKTLQEVINWRGEVTIYLPQGVNYKVVGTPYGLTDLVGTAESELPRSVNLAESENFNAVAEDYDIDPDELRDLLEDLGEENGNIQKTYSHFKADFANAIIDCPFEYTIRGKGDKIQFEVGRENYKYSKDNGDEVVIIGDFFMEISKDGVVMNDEYYDIDDDNIKIDDDSVTIGRYTIKK
ncbi:MAG: hypothetical protein IKV41_06835 [Oscillospiraceae bacterium]|nr:hypothetical protein [Oscillospiraceae bacterium]